MGGSVSLGRRAFAECVGTLLLLCIVIGSGIMAERLSAGNTAIALLGNTFATVFGLYVLIEVMGPTNGAHFNLAVSAVMAYRGEIIICKPRCCFRTHVDGKLFWDCTRKCGRIHCSTVCWRCHWGFA